MYEVTEVLVSAYLSSADVAGGFISPDVLLSCLKSKAIHLLPSCISAIQQKLLCWEYII